ncbi:cysteine hydrolase [Compostibacter hankyongensis]|uniref:Cysteine hydrolase n=2 Tax=Compostibacter hankyongensis TaxID=1007089 RepID=A0ABP8FN06_9BACT
MDMQSSILGRLPGAAGFVSHVAKAIAAARSRNIPVIYVVVGFRPGAPEISVHNKGFSAMGGKERWTAEFANQWTKIHPGLAPGEEDVIITKRRVSAFTGSDLEVVLRGQEIRHLVLTGISTSGVVLSTLREAADKDYQLTVIADCCADPEEEVHRVLTAKVFPRQAEVVNVEEWMK